MEMLFLGGLPHPIGAAHRVFELLWKNVRTDTVQLEASSEAGYPSSDVPFA